MKNCLYIIVCILLGCGAAATQTFNTRYRIPGSLGGGGFHTFTLNGNYYNTYVFSTSTGATQKVIYSKLDSGFNPVFEKRIITPGSAFYPSSGFVQRNNKLYSVLNEENTQQNIHIISWDIPTDSITTFFSITDTTLGFFSARQINTCQNGDLLLAGQQQLTGSQNTNVFLMRVDSTGNFRWKRVYGAGNLEDAHSVMELDNGTILIGASRRDFTNTDLWEHWYILTDSAGNMLNNDLVDRPYLTGFISNLTTYNVDTILVPSFIADHFSTQFGVYFYDASISLIDNNGDHLSDLIFPIDSAASSFTRVHILEDNTIITAGNTFLIKYTLPLQHYYGRLLKANIIGEIIWERFHYFLNGIHTDGHGTSKNIIYDFVPTSDKGFFAIGYLIPSSPDTGYADVWLLKTDSMGCVVPGCHLLNQVTLSGAEGGLRVFPNPASDYLHFMLLENMNNGTAAVSLTDIQGQEVYRELIPVQEGMQYTLSVAEFPPGIYIVQVEKDGKAIGREKIIIR